jgi:prolyl-tRNA editing enzyme YbaK/EbsC (Cys-tRNA(Pro) deacylase)
MAMHANTQRIVDILAGAGAGGEVREFDESTHTAKEAAAALGCPVGAIASSLVFMADDTPLLIVTSGGHRVDVGIVGDLLGGAKLRQATPEEVRSATGFPIGGVAPVAHPQPIRTLVDVALRDYPVVWASAGTPRAVFSTTFAELVRLTGGEEAAVA